MKEFGIISKFVKKVDGQGVTLGPGDDCSVVEYDKNHYLVSSTDCLVESVHFRLQDLSMNELGFKSLAVNISDISAMGAKPQWAHLTLAITSSISEKQVGEFFEGFYRLADQWDIKLLGGDMSSSPQSLFINVHVSGLVAKSAIQYRSDFKKSDLLCVTGPLGDSSAGLYCLSHKLQGENEGRLVKCHVEPPVVSPEAQWLASQPDVHGMMDLSDGLQSDLQRIDGIGFEIELTQVPLSSELKSFCNNQKLDPLPFALAGGEDYQILFGLSHKALAPLQKAYKDQFKKEFHCIGKITPDQCETVYKLNGSPQKMNLKGFEHFSDASD